MRKLSYGKAINEALFQAMQLDPGVIVVGQLVDYKSGIFGTTTGLVERFGVDRVQDVPVAESLMTAAAIGETVVGVRPVLVHQRLDFLIYSLDAIVNWMSLWRFKSNGHCSLPITIRVIVGKGWGQGAQHSKSLHAWFAHLPGIRVGMPATAFDAKGLLLDSIFGENPTIMIEHRSLFSMEDNVPEEAYRVRFGKAIIRRSGSDLTLVAVGLMVPLAMRTAETLAKESIDVEVIDLRTVSPIDKKTIISSVSKTKRLAVADPGWRSFGVAAEIMAVVSEHLGSEMTTNSTRICLPDSHTPTSCVLEDQYYPNEASMINAIHDLLGT